MNRNLADKIPRDKKIEDGIICLNHSIQHQSFKYLTNRSNKVGIRIKTKRHICIPLVWLVKRLLKPYEPILILFELDTWKYRSNEFKELLVDIYEHIIVKKEVKKCAKLPEDTNEIVKLISKAIQQDERNIALLFLNVDSKPKEYLDKLKSFWDGLKTHSYVFMLWVDYEDNNDWRSVYNFPKKVNDSWDSNTLLDLDIQDTFDIEDIKFWVKSDYCYFNQNFPDLIYSETAIENIINIILDDSQTGEPEAILRAIYQQYQLDWESNRKKWQNFQ